MKKTYSIYVSSIEERWGFDEWRGGLSKEQAENLLKTALLKFQYAEIREN